LLVSGGAICDLAHVLAASATTAPGAAFGFGEKVKDSHSGQMPWLKPEHLVQGDLDPNMDFRSVYSTIPDKISREPSGSVSLSFFKRSIVEHQR